MGTGRAVGTGRRSPGQLVSRASSAAGGTSGPGCRASSRRCLRGRPRDKREGHPAAAAGGLVIADAAFDVAAGDLLDPVRVDEPQPGAGVDHDPVEQVQLRHLKHVLQRADLVPAGRKHSRSGDRGLIGNSRIVVHVGLRSAEGSDGDGSRDQPSRPGRLSARWRPAWPARLATCTRSGLLARRRRRSRDGPASGRSPGTPTSGTSPGTRRSSPPLDRLALLEESSDAAIEMQRLLMLNMDPPRHTRQRSFVNREFTPRVIGRLEQHVREICEALIDAGGAARAGRLCHRYRGAAAAAGDLRAGRRRAGGPRADLRAVEPAGRLR